MAGFVYILRLANGQYYIGSTNNLVRRLCEHNSGKTPSIRDKIPAAFVFSQEFESLILARRAEIKLKKFKNRSVLEQIIADGYMKI